LSESGCPGFKDLQDFRLQIFDLIYYPLKVGKKEFGYLFTRIFDIDCFL